MMTDGVVSLRPFDPDAPAPKVKTFTARELQNTTFPPIRYVVEGYVVEGLTLLAGKPKMGKSWMVLDWSLAVACGGPAFGTIECEQGDVLYAALEDNQRRLQARVQQIMGDVADWPERLSFTTTLPRLNVGGLDELEIWRQSVTDPRLIVIDTLSKVRPQHKSSDTNYDGDYAALAPLQEWASEHSIAVVLVHHLRKMGSDDDPLDMVSGTTGLTGAADTILVLSRDGGAVTPAVTLQGRGRDIEDVEVACRHDPVTGQWSILGAAPEVRRSDERGMIIGALRDAGEAIGPKEISEATGMPQGNIRRLLFKMVRAGEVERAQYGRYREVSTVYPGNTGNSGNTWWEDEP